ncbi:MAG: AAA family ATPase [Candidatus Micrarchaeia archaeon]
MQTQKENQNIGASISGERTKAYLKMLQKNEGFWASVIVFLGSLSLFSAIPFYPLPLAVLLALVCGGVAYKSPPLGVALGFILILPALSYQSPIFGWIGLLLLALVFFEVFSSWGEIALLEILVLLPFAAFPISLLGGLVYFGMVLGSFHFGSAKSVVISIPAVFMILLLSSIWLAPNSAFFPLNLDQYSPGISYLQLQKPALSMGAVGGEFGPALTNMVNLEAAGMAWNTISQLFGNAFKIFVSDSGLLQLAVWAGVLFFAGWFPGNSRSKWKQTIAAVPIILVPVAYLLISFIYGYDFNFLMFVYAGISVGGVALLDHKGVKVSREKSISRSKKMKKFGKFGFQDVSESGETMDNVGGYEDVKKELQDSIMLPLRNKGLALAYKLKVPSGILLFGPPGTGKTMLMRAMANEMDYNFYPVKTPEILSQWYGESLPYYEKILVRNREGRVSRKRIGEVVENRLPVEVLAFDKEGKARFSRITKHIKHKSTSPIYEVKTRTGRRIRVTGYHSLFAFNGATLEETKTSELTPKSSYIAVPSGMPEPACPVKEINLLAHLSGNDHGLFVSGISEYAEKACKKLGTEKTRQVLGYRSVEYMKRALREGRAVRVQKFLRLMEEAGVGYQAKGLELLVKKKRFPAVVHIGEDLSTFLGLWVAEGSYNREDTVRISVSSEESGFAASLCRKLFGHVSIYNRGEGSDIYIGCRPLYVFMRHVLGLRDGAGEKSMPEIAFSLDHRNLSAFLRGYFSGDGSIYKNQHGTHMVEAATASRELADDVLYLLLRFGIVGRTYGKKEWTGKPSWRVYLNGGEQLRGFKGISFLDSRRKSKLDSYVSSIKWFRSEQIPVIGKMRDFVSERLPKWSCSKTIGKHILMEEQPAQDFELPRFLENDVYLDRVESVKQVEPEKYVYDVSVEPGQNFVAGLGGIYAHNSEKNVAEVFDRARKTAPSILFFDEIDAVGKKRSSAGTDSVTPRVLNVILQEMDGIKKTDKPVIVVGATNVPNQLDNALMRPGRFDKIIYMHLPDYDARKEIFRVALRGLPVSKNIDYGKLAKKSDRFSGADIQQVVKTALRRAAQEAKTQGKVVPITMKHILAVLEHTKPSTSLAAIENYEQFRMDFERSEAGAAEAEEERKKKEKKLGWDDVADLEDVKKAFREAIEVPLLHPELIEEFSVKPSKGILLFGPPGTGKTLVVKAASNELDISFLTISGAQLMQKGYAHATNVIKETFNRARENPPAVIFVDEMETFAPSRGRGRNDVVGQFLVEMDGIKGSEGVLVVGATNRPDILDKAILRPGRFDKVIYVPPPDKDARIELFKIHLGKFAKSLDLESLAKVTPGFTGADLAALSQKAKMRLLHKKLEGTATELKTQEILAMLSGMKPSVTSQMLEEYKRFVEKYGERR